MPRGVPNNKNKGTARVSVNHTGEAKKRSPKENLQAVMEAVALKRDLSSLEEARIITSYKLGESLGKLSEQEKARYEDLIR